MDYQSVHTRCYLRELIFNLMLTVADVAHQLVTFCREGRFVEAQTELMAPNCEQIEPTHATAPSVRGLPAILDKERAFQAVVVEMHSITISEPVVAGNFFSISLHFDLTLQGRGRTELAEIGLYEVREGKIVREQFFY